MLVPWCMYIIPSPCLSFFLLKPSEMAEWGSGGWDRGITSGRTVSALWLGAQLACKMQYLEAEPVRIPASWALRGKPYYVLHWPHLYSKESLSVWMSNYEHFSMTNFSEQKVACFTLEKIYREQICKSYLLMVISFRSKNRNVPIIVVSTLDIFLYIICLEVHFSRTLYYPVMPGWRKAWWELVLLTSGRK